MIFDGHTRGGSVPVKQKDPCPVCKATEWKPEQALFSGIECLVFVCGNCTLVFKGKQEELDYWLKLKNRPKIAAPISTNVILEVNQDQS
jgi:hypothetical protein